MKKNVFLCVVILCSSIILYVVAKGDLIKLSRSTNEESRQASNVLNKSETDSNSEIDRAIPSVTPYPTYQPGPAVASTLPTNWTFIKSTTCNVAFPLPPKELEQGSKRYWQFEEFGNADTMTARLIYRAMNEGGREGVPGAVEVMCSPNSGSNTNTWTEEALSLIKKSGTTTVKEKKNEYRWGKRVIAVHLQGGLYGINGDDSYYFLATQKHRYEIRRLFDPKEKLVKVTDQILDNLLFLD